jgi:hypothetical protein
MNTRRNLKRIIAGGLLSGGVAVAGFGLGAGTAQADSGQWCPGQPLPDSSIKVGHGCLPHLVPRRLGER